MKDVRVGDNIPKNVGNNRKYVFIRRPVPSTDQAIPSCFGLRHRTSNIYAYNKMKK